MLACYAPATPDALPIAALAPSALPQWLAGQGETVRNWVAASGFAARAQEICLLPAADGRIAGAAFGLGEETAPHAFGALPHGLPEGTVWRLAGIARADAAAVDAAMADAALGWALGAYRFTRYRPAKRAPARLVLPATSDALVHAVAAAEAAWMVRDLINMPANDLGPAELAQAALDLAAAFGGQGRIVSGEALLRDYPTVAMVGQGSPRAPRVAEITWSGAGADAPLVALCGKGVCFDTGGLDLKPAAGMLRMKKDMGGAAIVLGIARMVMALKLPVRLRVLVGAVENSVSGRAMRPLDIVRTRKGISVEVGNTDAEGRLVLCDLLADADAGNPALLIDCATLTGAARVAVGPDLPALFCNDETLAAGILSAGLAVSDPLWRLPLFPAYLRWLEKGAADLGNVSGQTHAGAIVAALFLQRFVSATTPWAHIDVYAWNDADRPGRPEGGEAQAMRALTATIANRFAGQSGPGRSE